MILKEIIELVQQHHPHMGETEIRKAIERASDQFCAETEIIDGIYYQNTTANKRYYALDTDIVKITKVMLAGEEIPRIIGEGLRLEDADTTGGSTN